jgi:Protein of unknown function (DUF2997)
MAQEEFEIEISPQGKVTVRTKGIKGPQCLEYAELFSQIIGREEFRQLTSEYYEQPAEVHDHTQLKQRRT